MKTSVLSFLAVVWALSLTLSIFVIRAFAADAPPTGSIVYSSHIHTLLHESVDFTAASPRLELDYRMGGGCNKHSLDARFTFTVRKDATGSTVLTATPEFLDLSAGGEDLCRAIIQVHGMLDLKEAITRAMHQQGLDSQYPGAQVELALPAIHMDSAPAINILPQ